jgi:alkanesulfonate monooxygenase SsuD/methylene tetrahydromethanopterin reductase-like flavin-dependent oxidoreductase (luciferase family)
MLALSIITADSPEQIEILQKTSELSWIQLITGRHGPLPSPQEAMDYTFSPSEENQLVDVRARRISGTPEQVKARIDDLMDQTQADELMISSMVWGHDNRVRALELMAEQFNLVRSTAVAAR